MQIYTIILCIALAVCTHGRYNTRLRNYALRHSIEDLLDERSYDNHNVPSERHSNVMKTVSYITIPYTTGIAPIDDIIGLGMNGFLYVKVASTGPGTSAYLFAKIDGSDATYLYHFYLRPTTAADAKTMYEQEGANGYRYKAQLFNGTHILFLYVKDTSQPFASYIFQYLPYPTDPDTLISDRIEGGKMGCIPASSFGGYNLTFLMKDPLYDTQYDFIVAPYVNSSAELLPQANDLGEQGYLFYNSFIQTKTLYSGSQQIKQTVYFFLYYKDLGNPNKKFNYRMMLKPTSASDYSSQMAEMGQAGFFVYRSISFPSDNSVGTIFVDLNKYQYAPEDLNQFMLTYYS